MQIFGWWGRAELQAELVQQLFSTVSTSEQPAMTAKLVEKFLAVESDFASLSAEMASPDQVIALLKMGELITLLLRTPCPVNTPKTPKKIKK
eukprot:6418686-Amphidinium_carterae.1